MFLMRDRYLAYFDLLGFKQFIENNTATEQMRGVDNIMIDIESAAAKNVTTPGRSGNVVADLTKFKVKTFLFSDTVIFWTEDDSLESLKEILEVAYNYNSRTTLQRFPARGALVCGHFREMFHDYQNKTGGAYVVSSVYGKALIDGYLLAESQDWSGAVIDQSVITKIQENGLNPIEFLSEHASLYDVPFKHEGGHELFAFKLSKDLTQGSMNETAFKNNEDSIYQNFKNYNKTIDDPSVQRKIDNVLKYLRSFLPNAAPNDPRESQM